MFFFKKNLHKISSGLFENNPALGLLLFIGLSLFVLWPIYFAIYTILIPYQIEFREGTALVTTDFFLNGINPYILANQPLGLNVYGMGYSIAVLPFAFLFGNSLLIHRAIVFVFILLSSGFGFAAVYKDRRDVVSALGCAAFVMTGLIGYGGIGAFPAAMGTFLFLVTILIPFARSFDKAGLFVSALFAVFSFYTKPYFVLAFGVVVVYLFLFVSKQKSLFYAALFLLIFAAFYALVRKAFPLYFINVIVANIFLTSKTPGTLANNLRQLFLCFYPILMVAAVSLMKDFLEWRSAFTYDIKKILIFYRWDQPFIAYPVDYFFYSFLFSFMAFLLVLGAHDGGTGLNYANQLLTPLFCIWFFRKVGFDNRFRFFIILILLFNLFVWEQKVLAPAMLEQKNSKEWAKLFDYVESSSRFLNSQFTVSKSVEMGLNLTDSGQTIIYYEIMPFPENIFLGPPYKTIKSSRFKYSKSVSRAIEEQQFDLVIISREKSVFFDLDTLYHHYSLVDEIEVNMPQTGQTWTALVWKPSMK